MQGEFIHSWEPALILSIFSPDFSDLPSYTCARVFFRKPVGPTLNLFFRYWDDGDHSKGIKKSWSIMWYWTIRVYSCRINANCTIPHCCYVTTKEDCHPLIIFVHFNKSDYQKYQGQEQLSAQRLQVYFSAFLKKEMFIMSNIQSMNSE